MSGRSRMHLPGFICGPNVGHFADINSTAAFVCYLLKWVSGLGEDLSDYADGFADDDVECLAVKLRRHCSLIGTHIKIETARGPKTKHADGRQDASTHVELRALFNNAFSASCLKKRMPRKRRIHGRFHAREIDYSCRGVLISFPVTGPIFATNPLAFNLSERSNFERTPRR